MNVAKGCKMLLKVTKSCRGRYVDINQLWVLEPVEGGEVRRAKGCPCLPAGRPFGNVPILAALVFLFLTTNCFAAASRILASNVAGVAVSATNLQYFCPVVTGALGLTTTGANGTITFRAAGTLSSLSCRVISGNRNANNPRVNFYLNGVEQTGSGKPEILLAPGGSPVGAGEYTDSTNTLSVSAGDTLSFHVASGGSGNANWTFTYIGCVFTPTTGTVTHLGAVGALAPSNNTTTYVVPASSNTASTTQAEGEMLIKLPAGVSSVVARNLYVRVSADTRGANTTVTLNGATGSGTAPNVAFSNGGAATYEDYSNSIVVNDGDKLSFKVVLPNSTGAVTLQEITIELYSASGNVYFLTAGNASGVSLSSTNFAFPVGGLLAANTTESRSQATINTAVTLAYLSSYVKTGNAGTITLRAGGQNVGSPGNVAVSTASGGAWVTDSTNTYSAASSALVNYNFTRTATPVVTSVVITAYTAPEAEGAAAPEALLKDCVIKDALIK